MGRQRGTKGLCMGQSFREAGQVSVGVSALVFVTQARGRWITCVSEQLEDLLEGKATQQQMV